MPGNPSHHKPSEAPPHTAADAIPNVPKELLEELHDANSDFGKARHEREQAVDAPSYSTTPRTVAKEHVSEAEKHVEDVTKKIDDILHRVDQPPASPSQSE